MYASATERLAWATVESFALLSPALGEMHEATLTVGDHTYTAVGETTRVAKACLVKLVVEGVSDGIDWRALAVDNAKVVKALFAPRSEAAFPPGGMLTGWRDRAEETLALDLQTRRDGVESPSPASGVGAGQ